jgi:hypothetical protein
VLVAGLTTAEAARRLDLGPADAGP